MAQPIWELESQRVAHEYGLVRAHRDQTDIHGYAFRKLPFTYIAPQMVVGALEADDAARCAELERVGDRLEARVTDDERKVTSTPRTVSGHGHCALPPMT